MTVYIDKEFKCHVQNDGTMQAVEHHLFDGKCKEFIEGYMFVPMGNSWAREDGKVINGEMLVAWKSYSELDAVQRSYEQSRLAETEEALNILMGVN